MIKWFKQYFCKKKIASEREALEIAEYVREFEKSHPNADVIYKGDRFH